MQASGETGLGFVERERSSNSTVIVDYPGHESLWCYRRFVCQSFLLLIAPRASCLKNVSRQPQHAENSTAAVTTTTVSGAPPETEQRTPWVRKAAAVDAVQQPAVHNVQADVKDNGVSGGTGVAAVACAAPAAATTALAAADLYDWPGWSRAVTEWYEGCLRQDAEEQKMGEEVDEEEEEEEVDDDLDGEESELGDECHGGEAVGELPGAPLGGGTLADFLGREARFALKCASDKVR